MELRESGYGCHINNAFVGALCYADDVTLPYAMIGLSEVFAQNFDITFNYFFTWEEGIATKPQVYLQ